MRTRDPERRGQRLHPTRFHAGLAVLAALGLTGSAAILLQPVQKPAQPVQ